MRLSQHGEKRIRKRVGTKNTSQLFLDALTLGTTADDYAGTFHRWLTWKSIEHKATPHIYKGNIFWENRGSLVTCIPVPPKFKNRKPRKKMVE